MDQKMTHKKGMTRRSLRPVVLMMLAMTMSMAVMAEPVDQESARQKAMEFLNGRAKARGNSAANDQQLSVAASTKGYHVFNSGKDGGFVIISGDDALPDVLGYSDNGRFDTTNLPPALQVWLKDCSEAAKYAGEHHLPKHQPAKTRGSGKSVGPLITTKWGQDAPYNNGYPQVNGTNCATGCVATAMAQIINYHKHPNGMTAEIPGYITKTYAIEMPTLPPTTFDWGNMLDSYKGNSTNAQKAAVSKLMIYCTTAARADLGPDKTGAYSPEPALKKYFKYGNGTRKILKTDVISDVWRELVFTELDEHRPILGIGESATKESAHAYVIDGYDANGLMSVNWGWNGYQDGFYNMFLSLPAPGLYTMTEMIIGISPEDIKLEYDDEEVVLTSIIGNQPTSTFYMYGNQCYINISATHTSYLKGTYDIDYNWAIYQNGLFVENLFSEEDEIHTFSQMASGNKYNETQLTLPSSKSQNLGKLFVEPGAYKLVPVSRKHGTKDWIENICTGENCLTILSFKDQYGSTNIRVFGGEPKSTVEQAQLAAVKSTFLGLKEAAEAKLSTVNQNALDIEAMIKTLQDLDELEDIVEVSGELDHQIRGMVFGEKKDLAAIYSNRLKALREQIEEAGNLPGISSYDNSQLQDYLKFYVKSAKGEIAMTQYIMNDKELKEAQQRANILAQQIESCDITNVTQEVSTAKKAFENLNVDELKKQVTDLVIDVKINLYGITPGDVNGDKVVNMKDIVDMVNYRLEKSPQTFSLDAADLNCNGDVDEDDIQTVISLILK